MQAFLIKRVRGSQGHQERVLRWVKRLRQRRLDSIQEYYNDWRTRPTSAPLWLWRFGFALCWQLARVYLWFALLPKLPRRILGVIVRFATASLKIALPFGMVIYLLSLLITAMVTASGPELAANTISLSQFTHNNSGNSSIASVNALMALTAGHQNMANRWVETGHTPFATDYHTSPPAKTPLWDWSRPLELQMSWEEGSCTTLANCRVHHIEVADTGDVGHFYGLTGWHEAPRLHLNTLNQMQHLLPQFPNIPLDLQKGLKQNHVLIVSYWDDNAWKMRLYDRRNLSAPVLRLIQLVHAKCSQ